MEASTEEIMERPPLLPSNFLDVLPLSFVEACRDQCTHRKGAYSSTNSLQPRHHPSVHQHFLDQRQLITQRYSKPHIEQGNLDRVSLLHRTL